MGREGGREGIGANSVTRERGYLDKDMRLLHYYPQTSL